MLLPLIITLIDLIFNGDIMITTRFGIVALIVGPFLKYSVLKSSIKVYTSFSNSQQ